MINVLKSHLSSLRSIEKQRIIWLRLSGFIAVAILAIIFNWEVIYRHHLSILVVSLGLVVSVVWWYWTMIIIRKLITARMTENKLLLQLVDDFEDLKKIIKELEKNT
jgi:hypothetical protein